MTRQEFDTWIEAHYTDLLKVARQRVANREDAGEVVHAVIANALNTNSYVQVQHPWTYYVNAIRGFAVTSRRSITRRTALRRDLKAAQLTEVAAERADAGFSLGRKRPAPHAD